MELGASPLEHLVPIVLGGLLAAPLGGWLVKRITARALMAPSIGSFHRIAIDLATVSGLFLRNELIMRDQSIMYVLD